MPAVGAVRSIEYRGKRVAVDEEGYLVNYGEWDEMAAQALAAQEGVGELPPDKISALKFIREYYERYNFFPILNAVCKHVHKPKDCVQEDFLNPLLAWKIAGLPRPEEPIISLLAAGQSPG
jgi:TusE/DsrC/DsvC family sulfur relay protein